jgi:UDP-glucose 4-epimerase
MGDRGGHAGAEEHLWCDQGRSGGSVPAVPSKPGTPLHRAQNVALFFPEEDDNRDVREAYSDDNVKVNEYLHRRVEIEDVVTAHLLASERAPAIGFRKYIVSATTPFLPDDLPALRVDAPRVVRLRVPEYEAEYERRGWKMFPSIGRVYVNDRAQRELGWRPRYCFNDIIGRLKAENDLRSPLARVIGSKGYHAEPFPDGPYPVE